MTQAILHVLRLTLVITVCCLSLHQAMEMPVRLDIYRGRMIDPAEMDHYYPGGRPIHALRPPFRRFDPKRGHHILLRKKRESVGKMINNGLFRFCQASPVYWPPCNIFYYLSKSLQPRLQEMIYEGSVDKKVRNEVKDDTLGNLRIQDPKIRKDLIGDEVNVRLTEPGTRQKRDTSIAEAMSGDQLPWDSEDQPGIDISLSDNQYEKRMTQFNSWGGKRSNGDSDEPSLEKRSVPFSSWGGKREPSFSSWGENREPEFSSWDEKREQAFSSWGGKRGSAFASWGGKRRPAFSSWGGKRGPAFSSWGGKRGQYFSSWGGKRDDTLFDDEGKRATKFSSWGGKRNPPFTGWEEKELTVNDSSNNVIDGKDEDYSGNMITETDSGSSPTVSSTTEREDGGEELGSVGKRSKFSSWGGKRLEHLGDPEEVPEKREIQFSPWGGKRDQFMKREFQGLFTTWGAKRGRSRSKQSSSPPLRPNRRGADFYPWGGKRSLSPSLGNILGA